MGGPCRPKSSRTCFKCDRKPVALVVSRTRALVLRACPMHRRDAIQWVERYDGGHKVSGPGGAT